MMLSRRNLLTAGLVFVTVWMLGLLSGCASPAPKMASVANGVKRVDLGSVTITMVSDGHGSRALDANFVRNATLAEVQMALREAGLPEDRLMIPYAVLLADIGSQRVLFDTGNGEFGAATADAGVAWVAQLARDLDVPTLAACGVKAAHAPLIVERAAVASGTKANPIPLTGAELAEILRRAL